LQGQRIPKQAKSETGKRKDKGDMREDYSRPARVKIYASMSWALLVEAIQQPTGDKFRLAWSAAYDLLFPDLLPTLKAGAAVVVLSLVFVRLEPIPAAALAAAIGALYGLSSQR
jgi:hypothetical protein